MSISWLSRALEESRARGFLGPGPIEPHIDHARGFVDLWSDHSPSSPPRRWLDLGTGGGLPGFLLLTMWSTPGVLLDSMVRRTSFLDEALNWEGAPANGTVVTARAEDAARVLGHAESFELVVARSFGPPAVVAECAVRFLELDGLLVVSEPPAGSDGYDRWPAEGLDQLGLESLGVRRFGSAFHVMRKVAITPEQYPRRSGVPTKRPLF